MRLLLFIALFATPTVRADTNLIPFVSVQNSKAVLSVQSSNGIGNFRLVGSTVTATNPPIPATATDGWLSIQSLGTSRNDWSGWVGCSLTNTTSGTITLTHAGRWVSTGSGAHVLRLYRITSSTNELVFSATVQAAGVTNGWSWVSLTGVGLAAYSAYFLLSEETNQGDQWYSADSVVSAVGSSVALGVAAYTTDPSVEISVLSTNTAYGPVNIKF